MNREQFFVSCATSYPKAILAMATFRTYVQDACQDVLRKHIEQLAIAIGHPEEDFTVSAYADPGQLSLDNRDSLFLGAKARRSNGKDQIWAYVYWERESKNDPYKQGVGFDVWPTGTAKREAFAMAIDDAVEVPPFGADDWWLWDSEGNVSCYIDLPDDRLAEFAGELDRLVGRVIEVVQSVENVDRFFCE